MRRAYSFLIILWTITFGLSGGTFAKTIGDEFPEANPALANKQRLSDWLLKRPPSAEEHREGIQWLVPQERHAQGMLKSELIEDLLRFQGKGGRNSGLIGMLRRLQVTGRVILPSTSPRWLQAHPQADPWIGPDDDLIVPSRATPVGVLQSAGTVCTLPHQPGASVLDYLSACNDKGLVEAHEAWIIQADGKVLTQFVANWNAMPLSELSPGAMIWAPSYRSGIDRDFSQKLVAFLSSQSVDRLAAASGSARRTHLVGPVGLTQQRAAQLTGNDWGHIGLLQTPTARMEPAGDFRVSYSFVYPYGRYNVFLQPFDDLSVGFRYSDIVNRKYTADITGRQSLKDKSIDFKYRLFTERKWWPEVALGMIDVGGTGLFASEYVVASKRLRNFDWTLGLGWGYMGKRNNIANPFIQIDPSYAVRGGNTGEVGGEFNFKKYFTGPTALFGGLQYHLPFDRWVLKAEYDGNDYRSEVGGNLAPSSPINVGLVYRQSPSIDWSIALERGNRLMVGLTLHAPIGSLKTPKISDRPTPRIEATYPTQSPPWLATAIDASELSGWGVIGFKQVGSQLTVEIDSLGGAHWNERLRRVIAAVHRDAPADIKSFNIVFIDNGIELSRREVSRAKWVAAQTQLLPPSAPLVPIKALPPEAKPKSSGSDSPTLWAREGSGFGFSLTPSWRQSIGGPDAFVLFSAGLAIPFKWSITNDWFVTGSVYLNLIDNYDNFTYTGPSKLPRVRTYAREYMTSSKITIPNLQMTHVGSISANNFYSLYGGYLDGGFAGIGAEWLYRPWHGPLAIGVDVNRVQQRGFDQLFRLEPAGTQTGYTVNTGHATVYWDTGWNNVHTRVKAGQYLAGDRGLTLELSRTFDNGVTVGAWATKTNVSAAQFGEGSFDKGFFLKIPFDVLMTVRSSAQANLVYHPLTRDGGAALNRSYTLFDATTARSLRRTSFAAD